MRGWRVCGVVVGLWIASVGCVEEDKDFDPPPGSSFAYGCESQADCAGGDEDQVCCYDLQEAGTSATCQGRCVRPGVCGVGLDQCSAGSAGDR